MRKLLLLAILVYTIFMLGCASEKSDFAKTENENSLQAFEIFLQKYPQGEYSAEVAKRIHKLAFQSAMQKDSLNVHREFQQRYPENEFSAEVNKRIEELTYQLAKQKDDLQSYKNFLKEFPLSHYANTAKQRIDDLRDFRERIDEMRAAFGLPPSRFSLVTVDTTISLVRRKTLEVMINFPKPDEYFSPENVLILEPMIDDSALYFVGMEGTPNIGPAYRADIKKGTIIEMRGGFHFGRSDPEFIVSPDENALLTLTVDNDEGCNEDENEVPCPPEAFSFSLYDLDKDEIRVIGKLPPGYSYAVGGHPASNMAEGLLPSGVFSWSRDDRLIHARVFSSRGSIQYGYGVPKRKAVGEVKFGPNQVSVKLLQ